ncbi:ABC transporter permease [Thermoflexus sp.]|uniref:ABC transporter permease n=2 Tax=Thermoflexus sp. TaxID=1969742 RepID=UPI0025F6E979|nr:ABC transporter permease [Thermoflexus sp.]MCS7351743.1 ABC transporter permease [Thermoflexus sp.]MCX7689561.1 ABC transporter permease [Thermoflexus sp.]MDW8181202.1 ABC transporter permease [Anaerolineae bacterium]
MVERNARGILQTWTGRLDAFTVLLQQSVQGGALWVPILAVLTALVIGGIVVTVATGQPFLALLAYQGLWEGAFGSPKALSETLVQMTPYVFAGLGIALAFHGGLFNIGAEGQLALGAIVAAWIGYALPPLVGGTIPPFLHIPLAILGGALAGALWAAIPGWLKARTGGHEVINTIMMNYIALLMASYLLNGPMRDPSPTNVVARTPRIAETARLPRLFADPDLRLHAGFLIALGVALLVAWLLWRTTLGFEIRTVGLNPHAARYAGISIVRITVLTMAMSGFLAGMAGAVQVTGLNYRHELSFNLGYGFDAIAVALLGKVHPLGVVLAAFLFGALRNGASRMQFLTQVPVDLISVIQALILMFVAAEAIVRALYRPLFRRATEAEQMVLTRGWGEL